MRQNKLIWLLLRLMFFVIIILTFSPIVISTNQSEPFLFNFPRTLWGGILSSILFILLTILGAIFITKKDN